MVSKVTISALVLCLLVSQSYQFPDHNRSRRADAPGLIPTPTFSIDDFQGWLNTMTNVMNLSSNKGKPAKEDKHDKTEGKGDD